jgi:hypothetical protein
MYFSSNQGDEQMALSDKAKQYLEYALTSQEVADEVVASLDKQAGAVAAIGATANLVGVDGTGSNAAPLVETEGRLDALEAKVDALIAALKASALMK